jgi:alkanesulfonate monooxygenase SsuD/methylene tetrahydromethanopterin reductase-like flavin-dependent oxidoreductase (luciferase family)
MSGNLPLSPDRLVVSDVGLAYRQSRVKHSTAGGHMFEGADHFSFHDDLLRRDRASLRTEQKAANSDDPSESGCDWTFRTCQISPRPTERSQRPVPPVRVRKVWAATCLLANAQTFDAADRTVEHRPSRLTLSLTALRA